jgi:hypothetical protein
LNTKSLGYNLTATILKVGLLAALFYAGWSIYRELPGGGLDTGDAANQTALRIVLRPSEKENGVAINIPVQLYPVDLAAVQREFGFERHPGVRFEEFLKDHMEGRAPVKSQFDDKGQATVTVTPGRWWVHAMLAGSENVEWRLPINVAGRQQTIELNDENIYARTKSF